MHTDLRVKKYELWFYFVIIAFLEPPLFSQIKIVDSFWLVLKVVAAVYSCVTLFRRKDKISIQQIMLALFQLSFVFATILYGGDVWISVKTIAFNLILYLFIDQMVRNKNHAIIKTLNNTLFMYIIINAILLVFFQDGFGPYINGYVITADSRLNFLGKDNALIFIFIFAITLSVMSYGKSALRTKMIIAITLFTMVFVWSGTGLLGIFLLVIYLLFIQGRKADRFLNFGKLTVAYIFIYFGLVIFRVQDNFSWLIEDILHKDVTLTGRTYLWDSALLYISQRPWTGYGISEIGMIERHGSYYSPHNLILQILISGGIVALILFLSVYMYSGIKMMKNGKVCRNLISAALFIYLFVSLTEATLNTQYLYLIMILACNINIMELHQCNG